jgi:hypothetical protein
MRRFIHVVDNFMFSPTWRSPCTDPGTRYTHVHVDRRQAQLTWMSFDVTMYCSRLSFEQLYDAQLAPTFVTRLYQRGRVKVTCSQTNTHKCSANIPLLHQSYTRKIPSHWIVHPPPKDRLQAQRHGAHLVTMRPQIITTSAANDRPKILTSKPRGGIPVTTTHGEQILFIFLIQLSCYSDLIIVL